MTNGRKNPSPLDLEFWALHRNRILGTLALLAAALLLFLFLRQRAQTSEAQAWAALVDPTTGSLRPEVDLEAVEGTSAEPWALFYTARSVFDRDRRTLEELEQALQHAERLRQAFPDHFLVTSGKADALIEDLRAEIAFLREHPFPDSNPPPSKDHWLRLATPLGDVRIEFYPDLAPVGSRWVAQLAASGVFEGASLAERFGHAVRLVREEKNEGDEESKKEGSQGEEEGVERKVVLGRVPDRNLLSHYAGAVGFARFEDWEEVPDPKLPRLSLYAGEEPFQDDSEVVIGMVTEGLGILEQVASRSVGDDGIHLQEPLAVQEVEISDALRALLPADERKSEDEEPSEGG